MKNLLIVGALALLISGCNPENKPAAGTGDKTGPAAVIENTKSAIGSAVAAVQTLEVGCAKCTYHLDGATTCGTAVKVGAKAYAVNVPGFDSMKEGLCSGAKQAKVTGQLEGDKFVASKIELIK